jgi:uncharacterized protein
MNGGSPGGAQQAPIKATCPTCRGVAYKSKDITSRLFPFCSERCQLIDLGRWISEDYKIPGEPAGDLPIDGEQRHGQDD